MATELHAVIRDPEGEQPNGEGSVFPTSGESQQRRRLLAGTRTLDGTIQRGLQTLMIDGVRIHHHPGVGNSRNYGLNGEICRNRLTMPKRAAPDGDAQSNAEAQQTFYLRATGDHRPGIL